MQTPLFYRSDLNNIARILGALLVLFGGIALILQAYLVDLLPPQGGFIEAQAMVITRERTGTFQEPAFLVTVSYDVVDDAGNTEEFRSGQRIDFEQYFELSEGDVVTINYDPRDPYDWRIDDNDNQLSAYGLGALMILFGVLSLAFPALINWASRREDFEFTDGLEDNPSIGAEF